MHNRINQTNRIQSFGDAVVRPKDSSEEAKNQVIRSRDLLNRVKGDLDSSEDRTCHLLVHPAKDIEDGFMYRIFPERWKPQDLVAERHVSQMLKDQYDRIEIVVTPLPEEITQNRIYDFLSTR